MNLAAISLRLGGRRLLWDSAAAKITNIPEANLAASLRQLPGVEIEGERAKADAHAEAWAKPAKSLDIP